MEIDLPLVFSLIADEGRHFRIGFPYGGHGGGDCEILLPKSKLDKFCTDETWAWQTAEKYFVVTTLGLPSLNESIDSINGDKSGIVPDDWQ